MSKDAEGYVSLVYKTKRVATSSTKRYYNSLQKTSKLPSAARDLLDYISERMGENNEVENTLGLRDGFLKHMNKDCAVKYSHQTVHKAFQKLKKHGLLIMRVKLRKVYTVNPLHYFKGTENKRKKLLRELYNEACKSGSSGSASRKALGL